jgi:multiple sugar transport system substrate-binding protein/putative aldouronate transport system substrate-binding protein
MKRIAKVLATATLAIAAVSFFGCGKKATSKADEEGDLSKIIPKDTLTLQVYDQLANFSGEQVGWFGDIMLKKFNVKLNIIPESGNTYTTRMESGDLGDLVIWGNDSDDYLDAAEGGYLFDWEEEDLLKNYGPYINDHMKMALEKNRSISTANKIFGFGHAVSSSPKDRQAFFYTWDLRFDLYKQLGCPEIKDLNDLAKVLADMKKICPTDDNGKETYGLSLFPDWDGNMVMFVKSLGTAYYGWDEFGFGLYDPQTGKYHPCLEEGGAYLESLKFVNNLYQKGLLDPDSQTQNYDAMGENYKNGTAFFNIFNWMASGSYNSQEHNEAGKAMYSVRPTKASPIVYGQSVYGGNRIWSIGAKTQYPELCMAILNWFSTPEGFMTCQYGPKGVTWDYDKDGKTYFTELGKNCQTDNNTAMPAPYNGLYKDGTFQINNQTWGLDATNPDSNGETYNKASWASEATPAKFQIEQEWRDWAKATSTEDYLGKGKFVVSPASDYSGAPMDDELKVKWNQVATCIKSGTWKAIYAKNDAEFNKIVSDMTAEAKSYGYDECNAFQEKEAIRRKAAEDKAAGLAVETPADTTAAK